MASPKNRSTRLLYGFRQNNSRVSHLENNYSDMYLHPAIVWQSKLIKHRVGIFMCAVLQQLRSGWDNEFHDEQKG